MQGINVVFYLNSRPGDQPTKVRAIFADVHFKVNDDWQRIKFTTGKSCEIRHWKKSQVWKGAENRIETNKALTDIAQRAEQVYSEALEAQTMPTPNGFKERILNKKPPVKQEHNFLADYGLFIQYHIERKTHRGSFAHIVNLEKHLRAFSKKEHYALSYESINLVFYAKFVAFLEKQPGRTGAEYNQNTVGNYVKKLKMFLNWAKTNNWHTNEAYRSKEFKIPSQRVETHYLTAEEKTALLYLDLRHRPALAAVRDWFCLACEVGLRLGDYPKLANRKNFVEVKEDGQTVGYEFHYTPQKTEKKSGQKVVVNLSDIALQILQRHGFEMPKPISEQPFNRALKELAQLAGIEKSISSHDARRTFVTLAFLDGMPPSLIMPMSGHRTEAEFKKYLRLTAEEYAAMWRTAVTKTRRAVKPGLLDNPLSVAA